MIKTDYFQQILAGKIRNLTATTNRENSVLKSISQIDLAVTPVSFPEGFISRTSRKTLFDLRELLYFEGDTFIEVAYRAVLNRPPDSNGLIHYRNKLESGTPRQYILLGLRLSPEGKNAGVNIKGLKRSVIFRLCCDIPVIGWIIESLQMMISLPKTSRRLGIMEINHTSGIIRSEIERDNMVEQLFANQKRLAMKVRLLEERLK